MGDLRDDLESAFAKEEAEGSSEDTTESVGDTTEEISTEETTTSESSTETEDKSTDTPTDEDSQTTDVSSKGGDQSAEGGSEDSSAGPQKSAQNDLKPPASWKPEVREHWKNLPAPVREEVERRERDFAVAIQRNSEAAKFGDHISHVLRPFEAVMQMEGASSVEAIHGMAVTAATLRMGTPQQKAKMAAKIVSDYDIDIEMLDSALAGEDMPNPEQNKLMEMIEARLKPVQEFMTTSQRTRQDQTAQRNTQVDTEISAFASDPKNEFFNDVREDMGDLVEMAHRRGRRMTIDEAYQIAISARPDLKKILDGRGGGDRVRAAAAAAKAKKNAASSVASSTLTPGHVKSGEARSLRDDIAAAWDDAAA